MNKKLILLSFFLTLFLGHSFAQVCASQRYQTPMFSVDVTIEPAIFATVDAVVYPPFINENTTYSRDLYFNLYEPSGDVLAKRPMIIMTFGGAFLLGSKTLQSELVEYCETMASKGYVVACIDYRLGFNTLDSRSSTRAVYRGFQDMKAAVRYFRENAAFYRIDPNNIFAGGNSAGGINAMHAAYVDEADRAASPLLEPTYVTDDGIFPDWPDLGCVDCSGNTFMQNSKPNGVINFWGAIGDVNWIDADEAPIISFHGEEDGIVNPDLAPPFGADAIFPALAGSTIIHNHTQAIGLKSEYYLYPGEGHEVWFNSTLKNEMFDLSTNFLYEILQPDPPTIVGASDACDRTQVTYCIDNPNPDSDYCWNVMGGTITNDNNTCITIDWTINNASATIEATETNCLEAISDPTVLNLFIEPIPTANFTFTYNDNVVDFTDQSLNATSYLWDFGDGNTSTLANPSHLYLTNGTFTVTLIVTNANGCTNTYVTTVTQSCRPNWDVLVSPTPNGMYQAEDWIRSSQTMQASSNVTLTAEDCVEMMPGFEVPLGAEFLGVTMPCNN